MSPAAGRETIERLEYVLNNPVQSGLVKRWCDDRVSGSRVFGPAGAGGGQAPALQRKLGDPLCRRGEDSVKGGHDV